MIELIPGKLYVALRDLSAIDYAVTSAYKGKVIKIGSVCLLVSVKNVDARPGWPAIIEMKLLLGKSELVVLINRFAIENSIERFCD